MGLVPKEMNWAFLFLQPNPKRNKQMQPFQTKIEFDKDAKEFKAVAKLELNLAFFLNDEIIFQTNEVHSKMITFYHHTKIPIDFWCTQDLNSDFLFVNKRLY